MRGASVDSVHITTSIDLQVLKGVNIYARAVHGIYEEGATRNSRIALLTPILF